MSRPVVITGEASETDSDEEVLLDKPTLMTSSVQGVLVSGEDSESENENDGSICSAVSALDQSHTDNERSSNYDSLLHQKLRESNKKLHTDIASGCQNFVGNATHTLNTVDQKLIRSQISLQAAVTSLKSLNYTSSMLKDKLQSLLSANFIPNISSSSNK